MKNSISQKISVSALLVGILLFSGVSTSGAGNEVTFDRGYADLVKKVGPGVVNISTFARPKIMPGQGMAGNDLFRRFFEEYFGGRMPPGMGPEDPNGNEDDDNGGAMPPRRAPRKGKAQPLALGTGFIIDAKEGLILTNFHVVQGSEEVKIQFAENDDDLAPAEIIGRDPELDVALLKVKGKKNLVAIPLGDSDKIDVGELVIAIGNPLGYGHTVSHGILSAKGRRNPEFRLGRYLQTDASINPGNSGGPLVNMRGEVIGINNAIDARGQGIGFAIPINLVKAILPELKAKGSVTRGYLGVSAADLTPEIAEQLKLPTVLKGVLVADVGKGTPADKAGIKPYDVITTIGGEKVSDAQDLTARITSVPVGEKVEIKLVRKGKEKVVSATVVERPVAGSIASSGGPHNKNEPKDEEATSFDDFGFVVQAMGPQDAMQYGLPPYAFKGRKLVVVVDVDRGRAADNAGLSQGDVLLDVGGVPIKTVADAEKAFKNAKGKVILRVKRFNQQGGEFVSVVVLSK